MTRIILGWLRIALQAEAAVDRIHQKFDELMAKAQDFKTLVTEINAETDRVAAKLDELAKKLEAGGMTEEEEAQVLTELQAASARLKTLGQNPTDPIPTEPVA